MRIRLQDILRFEANPRLELIRNAIVERLEALKVLDDEFQVRERLGQLDRYMPAEPPTCARPS